MARIAFHLRHPVANRLGRRLELLREIGGTTPCAHQLHHSAPVFRRIPCMTLGHRGSPSLSPLRHCPPNRVNSTLVDEDVIQTRWQEAIGHDLPKLNHTLSLEKGHYLTLDIANFKTVIAAVPLSECLKLPGISDGRL